MDKALMRLRFHLLNDLLPSIEFFTHYWLRVIEQILELIRQILFDYHLFRLYLFLFNPFCILLLLLDVLLLLLDVLLLLLIQLFLLNIFDFLLAFLFAFLRCILIVGFSLYFLHSLNSQSHIVRTEGWSAVLQMQRQVLAPIISERQASFNFLLHYPAERRQIRIDGQVIHFSFQFLITKKRASQCIHVIKVVQEVFSHLSQTDYPNETDLIHRRIMLCDYLGHVLYICLLISRDYLRDIRNVVHQCLRNAQFIITAQACRYIYCLLFLLLFLFYQFAFESYMHESCPYFVLP